MVTQAGPPRRDIFISYSKPDKPWVDHYLIRLLEAADVPYVIDDQDFAIGAPLEESIRNLIKECRYTLLVMTPDWVKGKWTHYESELAVQRRLESEGVSVLPLKLKACDVPPEIAKSLFLDLCKARTRDKEIVKLLRQLGVPEEGIANAQISISKKTLWFLIELLTEPEAQEKVSRLNEMFLEVQESNQVLQANKSLHDRLQEMEYPLQQLNSALADATPEKFEWGRVVREATTVLCQMLEGLTNFSETVPKNLVEVGWVRPMKPISDSIFSALKSRDIGRLRSYANWLSRQLDGLLPNINGRIVQRLKKQKLSEVFCAIYHLVDDIEFDEDAGGLVDRFKSKIQELTELETVIELKVLDHETLQLADSSLLLCNPGNDPTLFDIATHWNHVEDFVKTLKLNERYAKLLECSQQLTDQLNNITVRDDSFAESVKWTFGDFCNEMKKAFNKLDIDLLADCGKLKPCSDELLGLIRRMQSNDNRA